MKNIIIQAGGKGSRLESLTLNKPKAIVTINNLPIIFHLFKKFPNANYKIIADYKADVLKKYLDAYSNVNFEIIVPEFEGTASGIKNAVKSFDDEPFMIIWSDLILSDNFEVPILNKNYIGISKGFQCRWSYLDNQCVKQPSKEQGIAGLFIFKNKNEIQNIPEQGGLVSWLKDQKIEFETLTLEGTKEVGTMLDYDATKEITPKCRPFNKLEFSEDYVVKRPITKQGEELAVYEQNWYKFIEKYNFNSIPKVYEYNPLKLERIKGKNIFEYEDFTLAQKKSILSKIIADIKKLHSLDKPIDVNIDDCIENYIIKTFDRLNKVIDLVPFANSEYITINNKSYKNVFSVRNKLEKKVKSVLPKEFTIIHGDLTFSNIMLKPETNQPIMIDPRGYFGKTEMYGDPDYDWAKLYYSIYGNYDQFNIRNFSLEIQKDNVILNIKSNGWEELKDFFILESGVNEEKIKILHAIIWLSLTTYAWEDYDSICGAFYKGIIELSEVL